jgi:hypothetical protein
MIAMHFVSSFHEKTNKIVILIFFWLLGPYEGLTLLCRSRGSSVLCLTTVWTTGLQMFDPRHRQKDISSILCVQTGSEVHPTSCTMGTGCFFPGGKVRPGCDADHSPPSIAEAVNE